jgi:hypothetical protein
MLKSRAKRKAEYAAPVSKLTAIERRILRQWSAGEYVSSSDLEHCVEKFAWDWGIRWPVPGDFRAEDVIAGYIVGKNFRGAKLLSVWHGSMCGGGIDFYLSDVEFPDRQVLYYYDSAVECMCASRLSIFTTDTIRAEMRRILGERYSSGCCGPWDYSESILIPRDEIHRWRNELFPEGEEDDS